MKNNAYIVTFQNAYNYGAMLQCFALQQVLSTKIENVKVLNYDNKSIGNFYHIFYFPKNEKNVIKKYVKSFLSSIFYFRQLYKRNKSFKSFMKNNIHLTEKLNYHTIKQMDFSENTILISGSDQVWNTDLTDGFDDIYFLNFSKNSKKISYAASIGKQEFDSRYVENLKNSLRDFNFISLREETGRNEISKYTNKQIEVVLDPTLLLSKKEWEEYIPKQRSVHDEYIFVYMPDDNVIRATEMIAEKENLKIVNISKKKLFGNREINKFSADPFEFIELLKNSKYVITTSFHATSFSLIFNKPIWVFPPNGLSSRIVDLLKNVGMEDRILRDDAEFLNNDYKKEIEFELVNEKLAKMKKTSIKYLDNALNE